MGYRLNRQFKLALKFSYLSFGTGWREGESGPELPETLPETGEILEGFQIKMGMKPSTA